MLKPYLRRVVVLLGLVLVTACVPTSASQTATRPPSNAPATFPPTFTPQPTRTPRPTHTPAPTDVPPATRTLQASPIVSLEQLRSLLNAAVWQDGALGTVGYLYYENAPFMYGVILDIDVRCATAECGPDFMGKVLKALDTVAKSGAKTMVVPDTIRLGLRDSHQKDKGELIVFWQDAMDFVAGRITFEQLKQKSPY